MIAALFVETDGCYFGLPDVEPWDVMRDARHYVGPHPVVAHPPCQRWGRFAGSHPIKGSRYREIGEDDGCFAAAFEAVFKYGGVLEHPAHSKAWRRFNLSIPSLHGGWHPNLLRGHTCYVEQGHYGHFSRKPTWLYANIEGPLPELIWGRSEQRLPAYAVERYGYAKARRIGVMAAVGGKNKTRIRNATPEPFRDLLLSIARSARP